MTISAVIVAVASCSIAGVALLSQTNGGPMQEWTILGLLATVVVGIGGRMVVAIDKNTTAVNGLVVELRSRNEVDKQREKTLDRMAEGIAVLVSHKEG